MVIPLATTTVKGRVGASMSFPTFIFSLMATNFLTALPQMDIQSKVKLSCCFMQRDVNNNATFWFYGSHSCTFIARGRNSDDAVVARGNEVDFSPSFCLHALPAYSTVYSIFRHTGSSPTLRQPVLLVPVVPGRIYYTYCTYMFSSLHGLQCMYE